MESLTVEHGVYKGKEMINKLRNVVCNLCITLLGYLFMSQFMSIIFFKCILIKLSFRRRDFGLFLKLSTNCWLSTFKRDTSLALAISRIIFYSFSITNKGKW